MFQAIVNIYTSICNDLLGGSSLDIQLYVPEVSEPQEVAMDV